MKSGNAYVRELHATLPRLLALFDTDPVSPSFGEGDRFHWAWKLIDFGNGTFQGAANGFARLQMAGLLPDAISPESIDRRIAACFIGAERLRRQNGSMEEAFPYESSFCVTALVAYDLLTSIEQQSNRLSPKERDERFAVVAPMIHFLHQADEYHAFISNHLATAAVVLYKWYWLTGDGGEQRGREILERILKHQSEEGWYEEYGGADPGYQSLCTYYLADLHRLRPDLELGPSLHRSVRFLWHFAHPDGSFGGVYGSRHTRFFFPAGVEYLATECPEAAALAAFMRRSIAAQTTVILSVMDAPNLIPMFNAYAWAASILDSVERAASLFNPISDRPHESTEKLKREASPEPNRNPTLSGLSAVQETGKLPALQEDYSADFPHTGLHIRGNAAGYTVVNAAKGGAFLHSDRATGEVTVNGGVVARDPQGSYFSTQTFRRDQKAEIEANQIVVIAPFTRMHHQRPTPWQFVILRLLNLTVMRSLRIGDLIKRLLVKLLITGGRPLKSTVRRTITWSEKGPEVHDDWQLARGEKLSPVKVNGDFSAIHMASKGYWQRQDDQ